MKDQNFQFSFTSSKSTEEVFAILINPQAWWVGLFGEILDGKSEGINDEFSFKAGEGMHYSNQKLVEVIPNNKIVWLVTESNLTFFDNTNEWDGSRICFGIEEVGEKTQITFTHDGLVPQMECYGSCSSAWTKYMQNLQERLR